MSFAIWLVGAIACLLLITFLTGLFDIAVNDDWFLLLLLACLIWPVSLIFIALLLVGTMVWALGKGTRRLVMSLGAKR